jgi:hypothetical protein
MRSLARGGALGVSPGCAQPSAALPAHNAQVATTRIKQ